MILLCEVSRLRTTIVVLEEHFEELRIKYASLFSKHKFFKRMHYQIQDLKFYTFFFLLISRIVKIIASINNKFETILAYRFSFKLSKFNSLMLKMSKIKLANIKK